MQQRRRRRRGRGLASIVGAELAARPVVVEQKGPAADTRGLRLHQVQNHLGGDRRVDRRASGAEYVQSGTRRQGIRRGDHLPLGPGRQRGAGPE